MTTGKTIRLGLLGLGNVGSGVVRLLSDNAAAIQARLGGARVEVKRIAVRQADKARLVDVPGDLITTDPRAVVADPDIDVVVELIGGEEPARSLVLTALEHKKHVVTANKALLAEFGDELFSAARKNGVDLYFEASVGGGVPIIRALREGLASDRIDEIIGILNGTSNFLLTTMSEDGAPFDDVLRDAQAKGYAEADPALDVDGWDAAHKLCVLIPLCFGTRAKVSEVLVDGLRNVSPIDFRYAERFGYVIKPLVIAKDHGDSLEARVHATMIPQRFLLASVSGVYNALYVSSQALGNSLYYGRGAGMMPTAVAVVSDLIEVSRNLLSSVSSPPALRMRDLSHKRVRKPSELTSRYYLRFAVADRPGVLAQLAGILGEHNVSISEVVQEAQHDAARPVTIVATTHEAKEGDVQAALAKIGALSTVLDSTRLIRIYDREIAR